MTYDHKDFLISQIGRMRKAAGSTETLKDSDFKIENLKKLYEELTDQEDLYPEI